MILLVSIIHCRRNNIIIKWPQLCVRCINYSLSQIEIERFNEESFRISNLLNDFPMDWWTLEPTSKGEREREVRKCYYHICISFPTKCGLASEFESHIFRLRPVIIVVCTFTIVQFYTKRLLRLNWLLFVFGQIGKLIRLKIPVNLESWWLCLEYVRRTVTSHHHAILLWITVTHPKYMYVEVRASSSVKRKKFHLKLALY